MYMTDDYRIDVRSLITQINLKTRRNSAGLANGKNHKIYKEG